MNAELAYICNLQQTYYEFIIRINWFALLYVTSASVVYDYSLSKCDWFTSGLQADWKVHISYSYLWLDSRLFWRQRWSQLQLVFGIHLICYILFEKNNKLPTYCSTRQRGIQVVNLLSRSYGLSSCHIICIKAIRCWQVIFYKCVEHTYRVVPYFGEQSFSKVRILGVVLILSRLLLSGAIKLSEKFTKFQKLVQWFVYKLHAWILYKGFITPLLRVIPSSVLCSLMFLQTSDVRYHMSVKGFIIINAHPQRAHHSGKIWKVHRNGKPNNRL